MGRTLCKQVTRLKSTPVRETLFVTRRERWGSTSFLTGFLAALLVAPALLSAGCGDKAEGPNTSSVAPVPVEEWTVQGIDDPDDAPRRFMGYEFTVGLTYETSESISLRRAPSKGMFNKILSRGTRFKVVEKAEDPDGDAWYRIAYISGPEHKAPVALTAEYKRPLWLNGERVMRDAITQVEGAQQAEESEEEPGGA